MTKSGGSGAERRRGIYLGALVAVGVASVLRLTVTVAKDGGGDALTWEIAVIVVMAVVLVVFAVVVRRIGRLAHRVAALRPGAVVIPATTAAEMADVAAALGVSRRGLSGQGGSVVALAVLPDRLEVWVGKDDAPRWAIARADVTSVQVAPAVFGARHRDVVWVTATTGTVAVAPAYRAARAMSGSARREDLQRAVGEIVGTLALPTHSSGF